MKLRFTQFDMTDPNPAGKTYTVSPCGKTVEKGNASQTFEALVQTIEVDGISGFAEHCRGSKPARRS